MKKEIKVVALSDAHWHISNINVNPCDILIYCGDWSGRGTLTETIRFCNWLSKCEAEYKIVIPGNHDCVSYSNPGVVNNLIKDSGGTLLVDRGIQVYGLNIYGTPWCPRFGDWVYMRPESSLKQIFNLIPKDTHILLTHTPPNGILDLCGTVNIGSKSLSSALRGKPIPIHMFGHSHTPGYMISKSGNRRYYNVSVCDNDYNVVTEPTELTLEVDYETDSENNNLLKIVSVK